MNFSGTILVLIFSLYFFLPRSVKLSEKHLLYVKIAALDVEQAKHIMDYRKCNSERLAEFTSGVIPTVKVTEAHFLYEQSEIEYRRVCLLLKLTEKTGEYYGFGPPKKTP